MNCLVESNKKGEKHMNWLIWEEPHVINVYQTLEPHVSTCIKPSSLMFQHVSNPRLLKLL